MTNTQTSRKASAEAQKPQAQAKADFSGIMKYLTEKEGNLAKYSDKLRESILTVEAKLDSLIPSDFLMRGKAFWEEEDEYLGTVTYQIATLAEDEKWYAGLYIVKSFSTGEIRTTFKESSRRVLKALVQSGALLEFATIAAQKLAEAEKEYGQVAEAAEKMAKALEPDDVARIVETEEVGQ